MDDDTKKESMETNSPVATTEPKVAESVRAMAVIHYAAIGFSKKDIAKQMKCSEAFVYSVLGSHQGKKEVERLRSYMFVENPQKMFQAMAGKAAKVMHDMMMKSSVKDATRLEAASKVLDRAFGKPTQEVEHTGSLLRDIYKQLDARKVDKKQDVVDATYKDVAEDLNEMHQGVDSDEEV